MSHSVKITLIADQEIRLLGDLVNIHDLEYISLGSHGGIVSYSKRTQQPDSPDDRYGCSCGGVITYSGTCSDCNNPRRLHK